MSNIIRNPMSNGYSPREYAHEIAITGLLNAYKNRNGELEGLTPKEQDKAKKRFVELASKLAAAANLDMTPFGE
jgi:hypothetical protein